MGRLLRKKSPIKKKKSDEETSSAVSALTAETPSAMSPVSPSDEIRKKQVLPTKKPLSITKPAPVSQSNTVLNKSLQFLREVKAELRKVTWPSRNQTLGSTAVVIILVAIISMFLGAVDIALARLVQAVLG